jgi:hypothetical protein
MEIREGSSTAPFSDLVTAYTIIWTVCNFPASDRFALEAVITIFDIKVPAF